MESISLSENEQVQYRILRKLLDFRYMQLNSLRYDDEEVSPPLTDKQASWLDDGEPTAEKKAFIKERYQLFKNYYDGRLEEWKII